MLTVADVVQFLSDFAPPALAESWDNVGLLVGDMGQKVERVMTCLTITPDSAREAIDGHAELIVTHHPLPFRPLKRVTSETSEGRLLWDLIGAANFGLQPAHGVRFGRTRDQSAFGRRFGACRRIAARAGG